jgi:hypothetical protein
MISRRSELTSARLARDWPHWVVVRADQVATHHEEVLAFCDSLTLAPRHPTVRRNDVDYVVFCFAAPDHAERFRVRFDGQPFDPSQRGRRTRWQVVERGARIQARVDHCTAEVRDGSKPEELTLSK